MNFFLTQLAKLHANHPAVFVWVLLPLAAMVLNFAIWFFTSARWNQLLVAYPRLAGLMKMLKSAGIDPVSWLKGVYLLVVGRPWVEPVPSPAEKEAIVEMSYRTPPHMCSKCGTPIAVLAKATATTAVCALLGLGGLGLAGSTLEGCNWWTPAKSAEAEKAGVDLALCAANAYLANPQITPAGVAAQCAGLALIDAEKILVAMHRVGAAGASSAVSSTGPCLPVSSASSASTKPAPAPAPSGSHS